TSLLRQVPLFAELDEPLLQALAQRCRCKTFKTNEVLFHEGDEEESTLYVIVSGHIDIQRDTASGKTVHIARRGPGEYVGELALIDGKPRMADALTAEPCDLLLLRRADFIGCIEQSPRIALGVMACLADRLRQAASDLISRQELDVLGRLSEKLLELVAAHGVEVP